MDVRAVDVGFGRVKYMRDFGTEGDFPAVIGDFKPIKFTSGMESTDLLSRMALDCKGGRWYVGQAALEQSTPQNTIDEKRTVTTEGLVLLMAALTAMAQTLQEELNLVVGLPVLHYDAYKNQYVTETQTTHTVKLLSLTGSVDKHYNFTILNTKVLPQPFGTLFDALLNEDGELVEPELAAGKIGIINIGYNTVELARADNLEYIGQRSTSFPGLGMYSVFQGLSNAIYQEFRIKVNPEKLEPAVRSGYIRIAGTDTPIQGLLEDVLQTAAEQIISQVKSYWPDRWELDRIYISGGPANLLGPSIIEGLGAGQVQVRKHPMHANVRGYRKLAKRIWRV